MEILGGRDHVTVGGDPGGVLAGDVDRLLLTGVLVPVVVVGVRFGDLRLGVWYHGTRQPKRPQNQPLHLLGEREFMV